jgi:hypothetical protein
MGPGWWIALIAAALAVAIAPWDSRTTFAAAPVVVWSGLLARVRTVDTSPRRLPICHPTPATMPVSHSSPRWRTVTEVATPASAPEPGDPPRTTGGMNAHSIMASLVGFGGLFTGKPGEVNGIDLPLDGRGRTRRQTPRRGPAPRSTAPPRLRWPVRPGLR